MDSFFKDMKHSARLFIKAPGFTMAAVAALALGIAANTAIFSVVNTVLLKPFAYREPGRIVMLQNTLGNIRSGSTAPTEFNWWRQQTQGIEDISAYDFDVANWTGETIPEQIPISHVSADFFRLCGTNAVIGRTFTAADDLPNAPKTVVLAYAFWQRRFGGDPRVMGKRMTLSGERYEIIGVVDAQLEESQAAERSLLSGDIEIDAAPDVYLPFQIDPNSASHGHYFNVAGRLKPGVTLGAANAQLQAGYPGYARKWPSDDSPGRGFGVRGLQDAIVGGVRNSLLVLWAAVGLVLLIACANVANLMLARTTGRKREIAIRAAVGAGRGRIARQLLTESVMLSTAGGGLGLAAGYAGMQFMLRVLPGNIPRIGTGGANVGLDWRVAGFTLGISVLTGILFGLVPALKSSRADLSSTLKESSHRGSTGWRHHRTRAVLVTMEMSLAVVLLIGAMLLIRSFLAMRHVNPGFDAHNVLTMRMSLTGPQFAKVGSVRQVIDEGLRRIHAIPGVEAAATTCCVPLEDRWQAGFRIAGRDGGPNSEGITGWTRASAGYLDTLKIPILRGRAFTKRDESGPPVVIINETLAKRFWQNRDPLQDQIIFGGDETRRQIIGIAGDVHDDFLNRAARPSVYEPSVTGGGLLAWVIRTRVAPMSLRSEVEEQLRAASGGLPVAQARTMEETLSRSMATENFRTLVLTIFGCSALLLAAIGIYGLMAYSVAQRVQEMGIRLALGAEAKHIRKMVVLQGLRPAAAGVGCGWAAAFGLTRFLTSFLFGIKAWDPVVFIVVPGILTGVALIAVWLPALRASRVDPMDALRHD